MLNASLGAKQQHALLYYWSPVSSLAAEGIVWARQTSCDKLAGRTQRMLFFCEFPFSINKFVGFEPRQISQHTRTRSSASTRDTRRKEALGRQLSG
jgi:hypothetical protein